MAIIQGGNGYIVPFIVYHDEVEDLTGAFVEVGIERGGEKLNKQAIIDDPLTGKCHFVLTSSDLIVAGTYSYQWTAYFPDGRIYPGKKQSLVVSDKITSFTPGTGEETLVIPFALKSELEELKGQNGSGILTYNTLAELEAAYPGGTTQPVWIVSEQSWYYWDGVIIGDTTAPVLTITPAAGTYNADQSVTMSANETADIYYTLDGSTPTAASTKYTAPITVSATTTVKAFAKDTAGNQSAVQTVAYTIDLTVPDTTAPTVSASPNGGTFTDSQLVTLTANETATIYYTLDGTTPTEASAVYSAPISISESKTLKYFAKDTAGNSSAIQTQAYTINIPVEDTTAPILTITPAATFTDTQTVNMSTDETATIWYTLDDSDPVTSGTRLQYTAPLTLTETDTIKAYAVDAANNASAVQTVTYTKETVTGGSYVNDASLLFYKDSPVNGETIPNPENYFNETEEFTLSVTFQPVVSGSNAANLLVSRWVVGGSENVMKFEWAWNDTVLGNLYGTKTDGTTAWNPQVTTSAYTDKTKYYHLVFKRQGTALTIHVDNVQVASTTILTTDIVRQVSTLPLTIGLSGKSGLFKNVAYYNRALTTEELTQNYNALK